MVLKKFGKEETNKKKIIIASSIIIVALLLIIGVSYAFWQATQVQEDTNIITSGCFGVSLEGNKAINLANSYPITEEDGMNTIPYTFTITNKCSGIANYVVNLEALSNTNFESTSVRVALDNTSKLYSEYEEASKYYSESKESRTLVRGILLGNESVTYNLRIWIDEEVTMSGQNKTFESKIIITSEERELIEPSIENIEATSTLDSINITYQANGDIAPTTCKWGLVEGTYDNEVEATNTNCNITGLSENTTYYYQICTETGKGNKCVEGNIKTKIPISKVKIGDYISMTPTSTSYTLPNELSGCTGETSTCVQNTINPSELNLWRVIRKNEDGTVDMVSDKVSSDKVYFYGKTGYINIVGALNIVAAQYANDKYVIRTRHIGYSNQTEKITNTTKLFQETSPWSQRTSIYNQWTGCNTSSYLCGTDESLGAGDIGYETDYNLVNGVYGNMIAKNPSGTVGEYWLASRMFYRDSSSYWGVDGRYVESSGDLKNYSLWRNGAGFGAYGIFRSVRPIVTLKSTTEIESGNGTGDSPYKLL